jgi:Flp pilus assembly pilin Flp
MVLRENVRNRLLPWLRCEEGQDMVEYSLLLAFVCLAGAAAFIGISGSTSGLWSSVNNRLANPQ